MKRVEGSMVGGQSSVETLCLQRDYAIIDMRRALMRDDTKAASAFRQRLLKIEAELLAANRGFSS